MATRLAESVDTPATVVAGVATVDGDAAARTPSPERRLRGRIASTDESAEETLHPDVEREIEDADGGHSMPSAFRASMERAFGADFGAVRLHADDHSNALNRALGGRAFTVGRDVFLGEGEGGPGTDQGRAVLAHELTHVVQQGKAPTAPGAPVQPAGGVQRLVQLLRGRIGKSGSGKTYYVVIGSPPFEVRYTIGSGEEFGVLKLSVGDEVEFDASVDGSRAINVRPAKQQAAPAPAVSGATAPAVTSPGAPAPAVVPAPAVLSSVPAATSSAPATSSSLSAPIHTGKSTWEVTYKQGAQMTGDMSHILHALFHARQAGVRIYYDSKFYLNAFRLAAHQEGVSLVALYARVKRLDPTRLNVETVEKKLQDQMLEQALTMHRYYLINGIEPDRIVLTRVDDVTTELPEAESTPGEATSALAAQFRQGPTSARQVAEKAMYKSLTPDEKVKLVEFYLKRLGKVSGNCFLLWHRRSAHVPGGLHPELDTNPHVLSQIIELLLPYQAPVILSGDNVAFPPWVYKGLERLPTIDLREFWNESDFPKAADPDLNVQRAKSRQYQSFIFQILTAKTNVVGISFETGGIAPLHIMGMKFVIIEPATVKDKALRLMKLDQPSERAEDRGKIALPNLRVLRPKGPLDVAFEISEIRRRLFQWMTSGQTGEWLPALQIAQRLQQANRLESQPLLRHLDVLLRGVMEAKAAPPRSGSSLAGTCNGILNYLDQQYGQHSALAGVALAELKQHIDTLVKMTPDPKQAALLLSDLAAIEELIARTKSGAGKKDRAAIAELEDAISGDWEPVTRGKVKKQGQKVATRMQGKRKDEKDEKDKGDKS
jgi:hypothetical protein